MVLAPAPAAPSNIDSCALLNEHTAAMEYGMIRFELSKIFYISAEEFGAQDMKELVSTMPAFCDDGSTRYEHKL